MLLLKLYRILHYQVFLNVNYLQNFFLTTNKVGIYNVCSGKVLKIKYIALKILLKVKKKIKLPKKIFFGKNKIDIIDQKDSNNKIKKLVKIKKRHDIFKEVDKIINYYY